jgi:anti-sigma factor RsiW
MDHLTTDLLVPLLDGELPADEARRCREHLAACETCRLESEQLGGACQPGGVWDLLDAAPTPVVPQGLADAILDRATKEVSTVAHEGHRLTTGRRWLRLGVPLAAAAAIILVVLLQPAPLNDRITNEPVVQIPANDVERILELQESLDVMNEYGDLIEYYDVLKHLDRIVQDENITL